MAHEGSGRREDLSRGERLVSPLEDQAPRSASEARVMGVRRIRSGSARIVARALVAMLACALLVVCGWSTWLYAAGDDPVAVVRSALGMASVDQGREASEGSPPPVRPEEGVEDAAVVASGADGAAGPGDGAVAREGDEAADEGVADSTDDSGDGSPSSGGTGSAGHQAMTPAAEDAGGDEEDGRINVSVTVDPSLGGGSPWSSPVTVAEGTSAYDALLATGASVNARPTLYGTYVAAIGGLAEGADTGWTYAVNGTQPNTAASNYRLSDGDVVVWTYVRVTG